MGKLDKTRKKEDKNREKRKKHKPLRLLNFFCYYSLLFNGYFCLSLDKAVSVFRYDIFSSRGREE